MLPQPPGPGQVAQGPGCCQGATQGIQPPEDFQSLPLLPLRSSCPHVVPMGSGTFAPVELGQEAGSPVSSAGPPEILTLGQARPWFLAPCAGLRQVRVQFLCARSPGPAEVQKLGYPCSGLDKVETRLWLLGCQA